MASWIVLKYVSTRIIRSWSCHKDLRQVAAGDFSWYQGGMNTAINLFKNLCNAMGCMTELLGYLARFARVFFQTRAFLPARLTVASGCAKHGYGARRGASSIQGMCTCKGPAEPTRKRTSRYLPSEDAISPLATGAGPSPGTSNQANATLPSTRADITAAVAGTHSLYLGLYHPCI